MIKVDMTGAQSFFDDAGPDYSAASKAHRKLMELQGDDDDFETVSWLSLPQYMQQNEMKQILQLSTRIRESSAVLVVVGIGGSYLGAKAAISMCTPFLCDTVAAPEILFAGTTLSPLALHEIASKIGDRDFSVNVISKSGDTLETSIVFRFLKQMLEEKYEKAEVKKRIIVTTDAVRGTLRKIAMEDGYDTLSIPPCIGGRYSVLSAVGLLPMAVAGLDIQRILEAACETFIGLSALSAENPAWQYAAARQHLYRQGRWIEILATYEPQMYYFQSWWRQLFGESEGKEGVGVYPSTVLYTADLHSMGQYIQDGPRILMETVISLETNALSYKVPFQMMNTDHLNFLAGKELHQINTIAQKAVKTAHIAGGVPNMEIMVPTCNEEGFAALVCFFELSCAISGYMLGVNPFDQPGVEAYKETMMHLLQQSLPWNENKV